MRRLLVDYLSSLQRGEPTIYENVAVIPLLASDLRIPKYRVLKEALDEGSARIVETGEIEELKIVNQGDSPVLVVQGEELIGSTQSRTVNTSILVASHSELGLPASCVEAFRGLDKGEKLASTGVVLPTIRADLSSTVEPSTYMADQSIVWDDVRYSLDVLHADPYTSTQAHSAIWRKLSMDRRFKKFKAKFKHGDMQVGSIFVVNNDAYALEFFESPDIWHKLYDRIMTSYLAYAYSLRDRKTIRKDFLDKVLNEFALKILGLKLMKGRGIGLGDKYIVEADGYMGESLIYENSPVHLILIKKRSRLRKYK